MTTATATSTTPANDSLWTARDAIAGAFRKPRFAQRAAYRAELFRLARAEVASLTDAELDAALRAMVAAGNLQARKVNGKTMYHYEHFWKRQDEQARRVVCVADDDPLGHFAPNIRRNGVWWTPNHAAILAALTTAEGCVTISLNGETGTATATAPTARAAYREAYRLLRLNRHTVPDLLRERAGLRRMLAQAERKIAADGALQMWLYDEMGRLRARNAELARENEELRREAAGESLGDDLAAIIAALTAERDTLRQQIERLQYDNVYLRAKAEEAWERLDDLQAAQAREEESEPLPF